MSAVRELMARIDRETEAYKLLFYGFNQVADHASITKRMEGMAVIEQTLHNDLAAVVGEEKAKEVLLQVLSCEDVTPLIPADLLEELENEEEKTEQAL